MQETNSSLVVTTLPPAASVLIFTGLDMSLLIHLAIPHNLTVHVLFFPVNLILRHYAEPPPSLLC